MPFFKKEEINSNVHSKLKSKSKQKIGVTSKIKTQQASHYTGY